jgi:hypothetical protein
MGAGGKNLHVNIPLTNVMLDYRPEGHIADQIFPIVEVAKQADSFLIWSQADKMRREETARAPGTEANKIGLDVTSDTFYCDNYALKIPLTVEDDVNMDAAYMSNLREGRAERVKDMLMLDWEVRAALQVTSTSNVGSSSAVGSAWTTYSNGNSDPLSDVWTAKFNVQDANGYDANCIVMANDAFKNFRQHADVIDILYGNAAAATGGSRYASRENVKAIFDLEKFLVGGAYYNTGEEGQSLSLSKMWGDHVLVYYNATRPSKDRPSFAYSFRWRSNKIANMTVEVHPFDRKIKAEEIEMGYYQDEKITSSGLGFLITNTTSSS